MTRSYLAAGRKERRRPSDVSRLRGPKSGLYQGISGTITNTFDLMPENRGPAFAQLKAETVGVCLRTLTTYILRKTKMKTLIKLMLLLGVVTVFTACDSGGGGGGKSTNVNSSRYYLDQYGQCIDRSTGYPAPAGVTCGTAGQQQCQPPAGYRYTNGVCYDPQNYPTNAQACNCTTTPQPGYPQPGYGTCYGLFYQPTYWGYQQINCSQQNYFCRGLMLYNQYGQMQYCQ